MKKKLSKKGRSEYLKDLEIVTREFILGRNLEFEMSSEKSSTNEDVFFVYVEPSQIGIFGLEESGDFYGAVALISLINYKIKEGFKEEEIDENQVIWTPFHTQEKFLKYICKPQVDLIKNEN